MSHLDELSNEELFDYSLSLQFISKMVESFYKADSSSIVLLDGDKSGRKLRHFHVHLLVRYANDLKAGANIFSLVSKFEEEYSALYSFIGFFDTYDLKSNQMSEMKEKVEMIGNHIIQFRDI